MTLNEPEGRTRMTRMPALSREEMDTEGQKVHDRVVGSTGRVGHGPAILYAYSPAVWRLHNESSRHLVECALTNRQVRIVSLMTVRHWNAAYPWSAQATTALKTGLEPEIVEAINDGRRPDFADATDAAVFDAAKELLATGNLSDAAYKAAEAALGYRRLADLVGTIGHFTTTAMSANVAGCTPADDAPSKLKG